MSEKKNPFAGLKVPEPPDDLRRQALDRARAALESGPRHDLWERIWESRTARLAWAASILVLVLGHLAVPSGGAGSTTEPSTLANVESTKQEELADILNLPRLSFDVQPMTALGERAPESETVSEENES